jgi:hypothetical protein
VRVLTQWLAPGMEHGEETDASAETTSIGGDLHQGFRYGAEQQGGKPNAGFGVQLLPRVGVG